jgi:hypothetical protein
MLEVEVASRQGRSQDATWLFRDNVPDRRDMYKKYRNVKMNAKKPKIVVVLQANQTTV